jgi:hypothetical protein
MDPNIWGPHLWIFLHSMSFTYGEDRLQATRKEQKHMYAFLESLKYVLPCSCKLNYKTHFNNNPPRLNNRRELFEWLVDLHNIVNIEYNNDISKNNGKPLKKLYSYKEVEKMYRQMYS